jgi:hypothetical protein
MAKPTNCPYCTRGVINKGKPNEHDCGHCNGTGQKEYPKTGKAPARPAHQAEYGERTKRSKAERERKTSRRVKNPKKKK